MKNYRPSIISLYNPLLVYSSIWLISLYLYSLDFTTNILGLNNHTLILVASSVVTFFILYLTLYLLKISTNSYKLNSNPLNSSYLSSDSLNKFKRIINYISVFWLFCSFIEILIFKGVPLVSVVILKQYDLDYTAFGLPTIHGLLNACYFSISTGYYIHYKITNDKKSLMYFRLLFLWPILLMTRAVLLWVSLEYFCVFLFFTRVTVKKVLFVLTGIIFFIFLFGYIGDSRVEQGELRFTDNFIKPEHKEIGKILPSGFVWVYLYTTTPLNNIVYNIDKANPKYDFYYTFSGLIPSFIRDNLSTTRNKYSVDLYEETFNVSSYFANYLADLGFKGTILFVSILQFIIILIYFSAKTMKLGSIISYSAIFYALVTSIFFDNFMSLVTIFQIILGFSINYFLYSKKIIKHV